MRSRSACHASAPFSHVLDDQHRGLVVVLAPNADHAQAPIAERDLVAKPPAVDALDRRRVGRCAVWLLELEGDGHP
jgi:hypothetical protein